MGLKKAADPTSAAPLPPGVASRLAAGALLIETLERKRTLDEALAATSSYANLKGPDRGFARALASAVLRQLGRLDIGLAPFLDRPLSAATPDVRALLRLGAAQLWLLETPAHAAVGETVAAAKNLPGARRAAGFLNAVLRKASADRAAFDAAPLLAIWPDWLQAEMVESLGQAGAQRLAQAQLAAPDLHLSAKDPARTAAELGGTLLASGTIVLERGFDEALAGYEAGAWWVQDEAAALPASLLAPQAGEMVIDLCAAPGGKTLQLAAAGARVIAVDRSAPRLKRLRENLARTGLGDRVEIVTADAAAWRPETLADAILLDAPCSALGTLRRHPEGAWIKRPADLTRFPEIQARLLAAAREMLKPNARLIYCVCTPLRGEGEAVIEGALAGGGWRRVPFSADEAGPFAASLTEAGDLLTLPRREWTHDAFYLARLMPAGG